MGLVHIIKQHSSKGWQKCQTKFLQIFHTPSSIEVGPEGYTCLDLTDFFQALPKAGVYGTNALMNVKSAA